MTRGLKLLVAAAVLVAAASSWTGAGAQEVPRHGKTPPPAAAAPAAKSAKSAIDDGRTTLIELSLNKATAVTLPRPVGKIIVGNEAVADVHFDPAQPNKVFILSKAIGSTNVFFIDRNGNTIEQAEVRVLFDQNGIAAALKHLMPDEPIEVSAFRDSVFLTGKVHSASAAKNAVDIARRFVANDANVTNMLTVIGGQQVILQVRVAEMDRDVRKSLSVNGTFQKFVNPLGGRGVRITTLSQTLSPTAFATGTLFTGTNVFGDPTFQALERQNLTKTLAEPTLTAISGETASFLSGGEFPFPSGLDDNGNPIFEFRKFGIGLNFTPTVLNEGRISMQISMEISAIDTASSLTLGVGGQATTVPGLSVKRTETTIDLPSGGTLMISGLLRDNLSDSILGFPYLKDVPILGALFASTQFQRQETELVVIVTAYVAKPIDNRAAAVSPTDGFEPASDIDIYLLGRLHRYYAKSERPLWADPISGPFGYIMK